jgi:hypothetical protein
MNMNRLFIGLTAALCWALCVTPALAQRAYPSADAAADAFVNALATNDPDSLRGVLGADWRRYIPVEGIDRDDVYDFLSAWSNQHSIVASGDRAHISVGAAGWSLPIPIVKSSAGWRFDPRAGADEIRTRRIGRNELNVMQAMLAYVDAQRDYALRDRRGDGVLQYAQKLLSSPGRHDGLYWPSKKGEEPSPLGSLFSGDVHAGEAGYLGYHYKILTAQGAAAPGGAYNYIIKGRMVSGFALVAWPVRYGDTGITSFIVSDDGVVFQKDLGPNSDAVARAMTVFNPDTTWRKAAVATASEPRLRMVFLKR